MSLCSRTKNEMLRGGINNFRRGGFNRTNKERNERHKRLFGTKAPKIRMGRNRI